MKYLTLELDLIVAECPCGSGKQPEKCCGIMKPRTYAVEMDARNYYESDGLAIGDDYSLNRIVDGEIKPLIGSLQFAQSYARSKKEKILLRGGTSGDHIMNPDSVLLGYDNVFAVDTNTRTIGSHEISVTGVLHAFITQQGQRYIVNYCIATLFEFWDAEVAPEKLGWYALITALQQDRIRGTGETCVIVDSELGQLDEINARRASIVEDYYLPANCSLVYASADAGTSTSNKLIRLCDRASTAKLEELGNDSHYDSLKETPYPCRWFRQWTP